MTDASAEPDESARRTRELASEVARLRQRVERVETLALRAGLGLVAAVLVAGLLVPFGSETRDGETTGWAVLTVPFTAHAEAGPEADSDPLAVLFFLGFGGLTVVVGAMLVTLVRMGSRDVGPNLGRVARALGVLAIIGASVVLLFTLQFVGNDSPRFSGGPGGLVLLAGAIVYLLLLRPSVRSTWEQPRSGRAGGPTTHASSRFH